MRCIDKVADAVIEASFWITDFLYDHTSWVVHNLVEVLCQKGELGKLLREHGNAANHRARHNQSPRESTLMHLGLYDPQAVHTCEVEALIDTGPFYNLVPLAIAHCPAPTRRVARSCVTAAYARRDTSQASKQLRSARRRSRRESVDGRGHRAGGRGIGARSTLGHDALMDERKSRFDRSIDIAP